MVLNILFSRIAQEFTSLVVMIQVLCLGLCISSSAASNSVKTQKITIEHSITITEPIENTLETTSKYLYPALVPYKEGYLKVSDVHTLWYACYGNPKGLPVIFLHGGPGAGCSGSAMRFFDPQHYHIILFDQRGAIRSKPFGEMQENTTADLVNDIEKLRKHLRINQWIIFGGSWGVTLALAYGESYPERCLGFILRGVFLGSSEENDNFWNGAKRTFPEAWAKLNKFLPSEERDNLLSAYYKRIFSQDPTISEPAVNAFNNYDLTLGFSYISPKKLEEHMRDKEQNISFARAFVHYSYNNFFLEDNQLIDNLYKIEHLPAIIIQGRYDTLCPLKNAYKLFENWPNSQLIIISNAGHASSESGTTKALVEATNRFKQLIKK